MYLLLFRVCNSSLDFSWIPDFTIHLPLTLDTTHEILFTSSTRYYLRIISNKNHCVLYSMYRFRFFHVPCAEPNLPFSHEEYPIGTLCYIKPMLIKSLRPLVNKGPIESSDAKRYRIKTARKRERRKMRKNLYCVLSFAWSSITSGSRYWWINMSIEIVIRP